LATSPHTKPPKLLLPARLALRAQTAFGVAL